MNDNYSFPIGIFPDRVREVIEEISSNRYFPVEYAAASVLFAFSVAIGARVTLEHEGRIFANMYIAIIGGQGSNKSAPVEWAIAPLLEVDHQHIIEYNQSVPAEGYASETCKRLIINDATQEILIRRLQENPLGIGQYYDELSSLFSNATRYSHASDDSFLLSLFNNKPITYDRVKTNHIQSTLRPYYSMIGTIQTRHFISLMQKHERFDRGLFSRMLLVPTVEGQPIFWRVSDDLPSDADTRYRAIIRELLSFRDSGTDDSPIVYHLSKEADNHIVLWQNDKEAAILRSGRENEQAIFRKIQIYVLRFAILLQVVSDHFGRTSNGSKDEKNTVTLLSAIHATLLADYFYSVSLDISSCLTPPKMTAKERGLYDALPTSFSTDEGLAIALKYNIRKTMFHAFINKIKGVLIIQPERGFYTKI